MTGRRSTRLTQDAVHRAVIRGEPLTLRDGQGLILIVGKRGAGWYHEYRLPGTDPATGRRRHRQLMRLGTYQPAFRLAEARAQNTAERAKVQAGRDVLAERHAEQRDNLARLSGPNTMTLAELVQQFERLRRDNWRPQTRIAFRTDLRDIVNGLGKLRVREVTRTHLAQFLLDFITAQQKAGRRGTRVQRIRMLLSALFLHAIDQEIVTNTPAVRLKLPQSSLVKARTRVLDATEIVSTWHALEHLATPCALALQLSLVTGARIGAVCAAAETELSLDGRLDGTSDGKPVWRIPGIAGRKTKTMQTMPLSPLAVTLWRRALSWPGRNPGDPVFPGRATSKPLWANSVNWAWRRACETGLLPMDTTPHDLRRTARSWWSGLPHGQGREILERLLGHTVGNKIERIYDHSLYLPQQRAVANAWAEWLKEVAGAPVRVVKLAAKRSA